MSESKWLGLATKRLDLSKGGTGSPKMEYLMVAVLGLIIALSLGFTLWGVFFGDSSGPAGGMEGDIHFQCTACSNEFTKSGEEMEKIMPTALMPEMGLLQVDCPKCGKKESCLMQTKCPNCGKYYLSDMMVANAKAFDEAKAAARAEGKDPSTVMPVFPAAGEQPKDVCKHCGTDRVQWYIDYYKKRRG
ncbi:MAG: hypothetical protein BWX88_02570 [Planctomycetes bacterium ADurb.Bin126]|nr:MAG: hypothetical protein BWX88_02570 [Planctomycetes bacterium ADurb.Bin126]HOD80084.1 hypothetical protein [Phycisphaerae bacterium]HQL74500.1 hypothetical protein [Phycisphaerae bacterium]